jgi:High potential iron-sulfur protein
VLRFRNIVYNATPSSNEIATARRRARPGRATDSEEIPLSKIARRKFIQLSAVAAAGYLVSPGREAAAQDLPHLSADDPMAAAMKYTPDSSTVDPSARANPAPDQHCANCALVQGQDGDEWRPCQIFPGKAVNANGWCSVWAPKA